MAENAFTFRTALQGFNRTDVMNFIESTTAAHETALHQLQMENSRSATRKKKYSGLIDAVLLSFR